jgi:carbonic anhydrase/acetyltransferase-like protein (isoleucine patch superfamily)
VIRAFEGHFPKIGQGTLIDETSVVIGKVTFGEDCNILPLCVIRGDVNQITIGSKTNIQDGSILHVSHQGKFNPDGAELIIGNEVSVAHRVMLHGCRIGNQCMIGMGSIITDNAIVEDRVMIGSGTLVPPGKRLESGYLYLGNPVRQVRKLSDQEIEHMIYIAQYYVDLKNRF